MAPIVANASTVDARRHSASASSPPDFQPDPAGVTATTCADQGQYQSDVIRPCSTSDGRPSHTSVVRSVNSMVAGSMCQEYPTLTSDSPRTTRPFGMRGAAWPARSFCAVAISSGSVKRLWYSSASATRTVTTTSIGAAGGYTGATVPPQAASMTARYSVITKVT